MRVSIIGAGYVGLVTGVGLASIGHDVICVDQLSAKVDMISRATSPIYEAGLDELLAQLVGSKLTATTNLQEAVVGTDLTLIAVGTPFDGRRIDLTYVEQASREVGAALAGKDSYHTVVVKSTVVPGTTESIVLPLLEESSGKRAGPDFGLAMNPEFLREGDAIRDFLNPDRVVIGGIDRRSIDVVTDLYAQFASSDLVITTPSTAEMIKYTSNSLLATLISFSNEIANLSAKVGVDAMEVMRGVHLDKRLTPITDSGARIWPGLVSYLEPGCGFGGSCFPKDVQALAAFGLQNGVPMRILESVMEVNRQQPTKVLSLLQNHYPDITDVAVTVLGMAFKPGTDDIRESPAMNVARQLVAAGASVTVYDPVANDAVATELGEQVRYADSLGAALKDAQALLIMTRWDEFKDVPELIKDLPVAPVVIDGRRVLQKDSVALYEGIGL